MRPVQSFQSSMSLSWFLLYPCIRLDDTITKYWCKLTQIEILNVPLHGYFVRIVPFEKSYMLPKISTLKIRWTSSPTQVGGRCTPTYVIVG